MKDKSIKKESSIIIISLTIAGIITAALIMTGSMKPAKGMTVAKINKDEITAVYHSYLKQYRKSCQKNHTTVEVTVRPESIWDDEPQIDIPSF